MKSLKSCVGERKTRVDAISFSLPLLAYIALVLLLPTIAILVIVFAGEVERQPRWDTGFLDDTDRKMISDALAALNPGENPSQGHGAGKIAFLFLVRGPLPLESLWERFLKGKDSLYSIYIHASLPGFNIDDHTNSSLFKSRQIPGVQIMWGGPNMIRAERRLLAAALVDPLNRRFVFVSESCVPVRNFTYIYEYLFSTEQSFITSHLSSWRYKSSMHPVIKSSQFRKGSQWLVLIREHAVMVVNDTLFYEVFLSARAEIPDESYIQTIIPLLDLQKVNPRGVEYVHWRSASSRHPDTFLQSEVTETLLRAIQESRKPPVETIGFLRMSKGEPCQVNGEDAPCFLFARKFSPNTLDVLQSLDHVLGY